MLPVEPRMSQFMGQNIPSSCDGKSLSDIDRFGFIVPYPVGIGVLSIHLRIRNLPNHDVVAEGKDDLIGYSHRVLLQSTVTESPLHCSSRVAYHISYFLFPLKISLKSYG